MVTLEFLGANGTVTGSKQLVETAGSECYWTAGSTRDSKPVANEARTCPDGGCVWDGATEEVSVMRDDGRRDSPVAVMQAISQLEEVARIDTIYRDLYLRRARGGS